MKLHLSSQIVLNKVPEEFYHPRTAVERSEITRCEKIPTDIFPKVEEGAASIADEVAKLIKQRKDEGRYCVLGLGTGKSLIPVYDELIARYEKKKLSFSNVIVFNAYEYFPLAKNRVYNTPNQGHCQEKYIFWAIMICFGYSGPWRRRPSSPPPWPVSP